MEVLSPVGCQENLEVAIANGADAVYLGVSLFNARRFAQNFKLSGLKQVVLQAHLHGVKVYLTMNTLVRDNEMNSWFKALEKAYLAGIDAVIIQEVSFAARIKKMFPGLEVHASTQASVMNYHSLAWLEEFDLYVLARELTKEQIQLVRSHTEKKLEVFVHGHLCISYSGQCLISSMIGSRSGNRGVCASSCRKKYNGIGYLISAKDLNLSDSVKSLYDLGVDSIKIEGRMKNAEYVGTVTQVYRTQVDAAEKGVDRTVSNEEIDLMKMGFNREYTQGFYNNVGSIVGKDLPMNRGIKLGVVKNKELHLAHDLSVWDGVSIWHARNDGKLSGFLVNKILVNGKEVEHASKGDVITIPSRQFMNGATVFLTSRGSGDKPYKTLGKKVIPVSVRAKKGEGVTVEIEGETVVSDFILEESDKHALSKEHLDEVFAKDPLVVFAIESCEIEGALFFPRSKQTELRKQLIEVVETHYLPDRSSLREEIVCEEKKSSASAPVLMTKLYRVPDVMQADKMGVSCVYYDVFAPDVMDARKACEKTQFFLDTPVVMSDDDITRALDIIGKVKPDGIMVGNLGMATAYDGVKHGKYSLNTFNDLSLSWLQEHGVLPMISIELSGQQVCRLKNKDFMYYAHGRIPVMHFKGVYDQRVLRDEKEYVFPLRIVNGNTEMLHSRPFATLEHVRDLIDAGIMYFFLDLEQNVEELIGAYQGIINGEKQDLSLLKKGTTLKPFRMGVG